MPCGAGRIAPRGSPGSKWPYGRSSASASSGRSRESPRRTEPACRGGDPPLPINSLPPMLEIVYEIEGQTRRFLLSGGDVSIGRSSENGIVLNDFSVSRRDALLSQRGGVWTIEDLKSTNGVKVNDEFAPKSPLKADDVVSVGTFTLYVREQSTTKSIAAKSISDSSSTFVRSIADFNLDYNLEATGTGAGVTDVAGTLAGRRPAPEKAREKIFEILVQVARTLIEAPDVDQILSKVVDLLFDFLPAERAVVVLREDSGRLVATLARQRGRAGSEATETFSHTIVETVVRERVAI